MHTEKYKLHGNIFKFRNNYQLMYHFNIADQSS